MNKDMHSAASVGRKILTMMDSNRAHPVTVQIAKGAFRWSAVVAVASVVVVVVHESPFTVLAP